MIAVVLTLRVLVTHHTSSEPMINIYHRDGIHKASMLKHWVQDCSHPLIHGEQNSSTKYSPPQPHGGSSPEYFNATISDDTLECFNGTGSLCTLRPSLDCIKWHGSICCYNPSNSSIGKVHRRALLDLSGPFEILKDVISAHSECSSRCLFQCITSEATVDPKDTALLKNKSYSMHGRFEALLMSGIVN